MHKKILHIISSVFRVPHISVRAMQYILNMAVNAKISEGLIQKLSFEGFRIWPLVLWPLWEDFEKLAFAEEYL